MLRAAIIARVMGGRVYQGAALVPGPNHSAADRSLRVFPDPDADGGFRVHSFAGDDPIECRDHVRRKMALPAWQPTRKLNGDETVHLSGPSPAFEGSTLAPTQDGTLPIRTRPDADNKPKFVAWGDDGPLRSTDELRRHVYRRDGFPVRMKIKRADGTFVQWYRVRDGK